MFFFCFCFFFERTEELQLFHLISKNNYKNNIYFIKVQYESRENPLHDLYNILDIVDTELRKVLTIELWIF